MIINKKIKILKSIRVFNNLLINKNNLFHNQQQHKTSLKRHRLNPFKRNSNDLNLDTTTTTTNNVNRRGLFGYFTKTTLATIGFTGLCFTGCAIFYYENNRKLLTRNIPFFDKRFETRNELNRFWLSLPLTAKITIGIICTNFIVFVSWRIPKLNAFMTKYFLANPQSKSTFLSILFSTFSHQDPLHFFFNMACLWSFVMPLQSIFGGEQFLAYYLTSGFFASYLSNNYKLLTNRIVPSLGASGSILACVIMFCLSFPQDKIGIMFVPYGFDAENIMKFIIGFDVAGLLLGWRFFDHAAHLGGALFALWYFNYGHELLWKNQKKLIEKWHLYRSK